MMFSTDFNPQENIEKDGSGGKMLGIHVSTFDFILFQENWKRSTLPGEFGDERFSLS